MKLTPKQLELLNLAEDPQIISILIGGSAGGAKSWAICTLALIKSRKYPGYQAAISRRIGTVLNRTTKMTMRKVLKENELTEGKDYEWREGGSLLHFVNSSELRFMPLDERGDPDLTTIGSLEVDDFYIDEAGEITSNAHNVAKSRIGRGIAGRLYDIPGRMYLSCNPSQNFLKEEYYDNYERLGGGEMQKWQNGFTVLPNGERVPAYSVFLRMSVYDNSFISPSYIENLKSLPSKERKRLFEGRWDYADSDATLFPSDILLASLQYTRPDSKVFNKFIGVDVSDSGKDETIATLIDDNVVVAQVALKVNKQEGEPISSHLARALIDFATGHGFTPNEARRIAIESNGVGVGIRDMMRTKGWQITEYRATSKSRSQNYYQLFLDLEGGSLKIFAELPGYENIRRELAAHDYTMQNQDPVIESKDKIKAKIGRSPDHADSLMIANHARKLYKARDLSRRFRSISLGAL